MKILIESNNKNIGKIAIVKDKNSIYYNEWGRITDIDDDYYLSIADDTSSQPVFSRQDIKILSNTHPLVININNNMRYKNDKIN